MRRRNSLSGTPRDRAGSGPFEESQELSVSRSEPAG